MFEVWLVIKCAISTLPCFPSMHCSSCAVGLRKAEMHGRTNGAFWFTLLERFSGEFYRKRLIV